MRKITILASLIFFCNHVFSQNENELRDIVYKWSDANNNQDLKAYDFLYADQVMFYGKNKTHYECLNLKAGFFKKHPDYTDKISEVEFEYYKSGVIKCGFQKSVKYSGYNKTYPSYLLLQEVGNQVKIVGESDEISDNNIGYSLQLGEKISTTSNSIYFYSGTAIIAFIIIILIFKKNRKNSSPQTPFEKQYYKEDLLKSFQNNPDTESIGLGFEKYIVTKFDKKYFKLLHWQSDKHHNGIYPLSNMEPDLAYRYEYKYKRIEFAIECKYRSSFFDNKIQLFKDYQLDNYREYEIKTGRKVFIILGMGGNSEQPNQLYVIPLKDANNTVWDRNDLSKYYRHKKGSFFLDTDYLRLS